MTKKATVWTEQFRVRSYETDPGGTASIQTICNYLQEVAGNHAADLGVSLEHLTEQNLTWVLARLRVEMDVHPTWKDEVSIETWPSGVERLLATRDFLIRDADGDVIGGASSAWLLIDKERRRPVRLPESIISWELPKRDRPLGRLPDRLPDVTEGASVREVRVRYSDLDVNGHVNNVAYAEWSIESVPREVHDRHVVRTLDLHFRAEGTYGATVSVLSDCIDESDGRLTFAHVVRLDDRELAKARMEWVKR